MNLFDAFNVSREPEPQKPGTDEVEWDASNIIPRVVLKSDGSEYLEFDPRFNAEKQDTSNN
jgi:hypothetical protein